MNTDRVITVHRIGDFFEAVEDSARILHDICGCTLTFVCRNDGEHLLAGFPYQSLPAYASHINANGFVLAIKPEKGVK